MASDTLERDNALLSVSEAARRLERSTEQVRRYLREGRLSGRRIGGQWFIERATLDQFSASMRTQLTFVQKLGKAASIRPLDDVIGIGKGSGSNIGDGKAAYRLAANRRS
jgi:excisionase family DNA binding protein